MSLLRSEYHQDNIRPFDSLLNNSNHRCKWSCNAQGHTWEAKFQNRAALGQGCPFCSGKRVFPGFNDLATTHPELASELISPQPSEVTKGSNKVGTWKCSLGHQWQTKIYYRTRKTRPTGCPECKRWGTSKEEYSLFKFVESLGFDIVRNDRTVLVGFSVPAMELDVYIPSTRKAIEFSGRYWHGLPGAHERDARKAEACRKLGIDLLVVWDDDWRSGKSFDEVKAFLGGKP